MSHAPLIASQLATTLLGQELTTEECELLAQIMTQKKLVKNEILFEEGDVDETLYILVSGRLDVLKLIGGQSPISMDSIKQGGMVGDFVDTAPHPMRVAAKTESIILLLHKDSFEALIAQQPHLSYHVMRSILRYCYQNQRKVNDKYLEMHRLVQNQYMATY